ncbi:endonuclease/exonuclease/phosphatase family protein [Alteromonas sp. M12]|uniref:endonuclease/exonuclease/phosphatase family protein n=1 Tax=Alteromonas sp. M12 TaxID=3135644 RepID=UPI00319DF57E
MQLVSCANSQPTIRVATFNVSMEADNYRGTEAQQNQHDPTLLFKHLATGDNQQIKNIAQIIQRIRPDIILLNEFDYSSDPSLGPDAFINNYLQVSQQGQRAIDYPYFYYAPVNTGVASGVDLNNDDKIENSGSDAFGFGRYPGQYGMLLLSRYPIDLQGARTFQKFLWKDMPHNTLGKIKNTDGSAWYSPEAIQILRLSSKSHWDIPINIEGKTVHVLASHPTPPVFDGPENRNGLRNHDEIQFWNDYLDAGSKADYIYDDKGNRGGFSGERFVILGDLNASANEGDGERTMMADLLAHPRVAQHELPKSAGAKESNLNNPNAKYHTAKWGLTVDYVLPSKAGLSILDSGVFWPSKSEPGSELVEERQASSDHRLVWREVELK